MTINAGQHLLPPSATILERDVAALTQRLDQLTFPIAQLWKPIVLSSEASDTPVCPAELLPWLAWTVAVDTWQDDWLVSDDPADLERARKIIQESITVHKHKGTIGAVRRALAALGVDIIINEWWQMDPPGEPHVFDLEISANANLSKNFSAFLDDQLVVKIKNAVDKTKPVRSHYNIFKTAKFQNIITASTAVRSLETMHFSAENIPQNAAAYFVDCIDFHADTQLAGSFRAVVPILHPVKTKSVSMPDDYMARFRFPAQTTLGVHSRVVETIHFSAANIPQNAAPYFVDQVKFYSDTNVVSSMRAVIPLLHQAETTSVSMSDEYRATFNFLEKTDVSGYSRAITTMHFSAPNIPEAAAPYFIDSAEFCSATQVASSFRAVTLVLNKVETKAVSIANN